MSSQRALKCLSRVVLVLAFGTLLTTPWSQVRGEDKIQSVLRASCGPQDRPESGLQGQTTLAERFSPGPARTYNCNLELVGQFAGEGSAFGLNVFENCAYYSTWENPKMRHPGVVVLDVADPRQPKPTAYLDSPAMLSANESLEIDKTRKLLVASRWPSTAENPPFDIYDLSADCRRPVFVSSTAVPGVLSHAGQFAPDHKTFYSADTRTTASPGAAVSGIFVIDISDPAHPRSTAVWTPPNKNWRPHGVKLNTWGTRAYVALNPAGLVILDISDFASRRPQPQIRLVSTLLWDDTYVARWPLPVSIAGRPHLILADGAGTIPLAGARRAEVCRADKPGHGLVRIIDIGNEAQPKTISRLMLEVADPANCEKVVHDPTVLGYGPEGCDVDREVNPKLLACAHYEAGLRVFDIRDLTKPREIAYYKPPARRTEVRPGSPFSQTGPQLFPTAAPMDHTADVVAFAKVRNNGREIWFNSFDNGFQVVRFTERFIAAHQDLFDE